MLGDSDLFYRDLNLVQGAQPEGTFAKCRFYPANVKCLPDNTAVDLSLAK